MRLLTFIYVVVLAGCGGAEAPLTSPPPESFTKDDLAVGDGAAARPRARLSVHYTGWLYDASRPDNKGKQFDSSVGGEPFTFRLGASEVIPGWDRGFEGMRVGGKRRLIIPPDLGYGSTGVPAAGIPANAGLVFEMTLVEVQ